MNSLKFSIPWLQIMVMVLILVSISAARHDIPRLSPTRGIMLEHPELLSSAQDLKDVQTFYYPQTLDHFNYRPESFTSFQQRYMMNFRYWGGANASAPILVYLGAESSLDGAPVSIGFLNDNAIRFNALLVYIEHRYYGKSIPFGSREEAYKNASTLGYFNSAQAMADYAEIILHIKQELHSYYSPVIVIGGSYGGMLASWFRLKYPHVALGALASSAPILYFDDIIPHGAYFQVVSKDFRETSDTCYQTIRKSWAEIDKIASQANGVSTLSKKFQTCKPLTKSSELKGQLVSLYSEIAQYNYRPTMNSLKVICGGIDGSENEDILSKIFAGIVAYKGKRPCYINPPEDPGYSETMTGWSWQACSDMVIPLAIGENTMFQPEAFDLNEYIKDCKDAYGVPPRPHWVTSYFGGYDIKLVLQRFGGNIIFSNGLLDPYSRGGVLENLSESIIALNTVNGSHCLDILSERETDPEWLIKQREIEVKIIKEWMVKYYADLKAFRRYEFFSQDRN